MGRAPSQLPLGKAQLGSQVSITVAGSGPPASSAGHWALGMACSGHSLTLDRAALCWLATDVGRRTKRGIQGR